MIKKSLISLIAAGMFAATAATAGGIEVGDKSGSKLTMGMKSYINYAISKSTANGATTGKSSGIAVDRFYLWVDYELDDSWSAKIVTDVNNEQGNTTPGLKRNMNVFLKNAFIQGKLSPEMVLTAGLIGTPWVPFEERFWGHRHITNTFVDAHGYDASADYGIGLQGKLAAGLLNYQAAIVNGGGYGKPNKTDATDFGVRLNGTVAENVEAAVHYRSGYKGTKVFGVLNPTKSTLMQALVSYTMDSARVTAGYISNKDSKAGTTTTNTAFDVYGTYRLNEAMAAFARFDNRKQSVTATASDEKETRTILGVDYAVNSKLIVSLAFDNTKTSNSQTIATLGQTLKTTKYGIYSQLAF